MITSLILLIFIIISVLVIIGIRWKNITKFHHGHNSYFDFLFIAIYFSEQFIFLLLYNLHPGLRNLWVALIVLFAITTSSLDKFMMNVRQRRSSKDISQALEERGNLLETIEKQKKELDIKREENESLIDFIRREL